MTLPAQVLRAAGFWVFTAMYWLPLLPVLAALRLLAGGVGIPAVAGFWGRTALRILGMRLELVNPSPFTHPAPRVGVCNHPSALEVLWGAAICPPRPMAIGKRELVFIPVINLVWWALGFARVDRRDGARAIRSLEGVAGRVAREARTLLMAPEGTRSRDGEIAPFKKGAFHLAVGAQAPIYPIVVHGTFELLPRWAWLGKPGVIRIRFLPPIPTVGLGRADVDALAAETRARMITALAELRQSAP